MRGYRRHISAPRTIKKGVRIWSTVVDAYLTDWMTRNEAVAYIAQDRRNDTNMYIRDLKLNFPKGWIDRNSKGGYKIFTKED